MGVIVQRWVSGVGLIDLPVEDWWRPGIRILGGSGVVVYPAGPDYRGDWSNLVRVVDRDLQKPFFGREPRPYRERILAAIEEVNAWCQEKNGVIRQHRLEELTNEELVTDLLASIETDVRVL